MIRFLACVSLLMLGSVLHAQEPPPPGPAPTFVLVTKVLADKAMLATLVWSEVQVPVQVFKNVVVNGRTEMVTVTELRTQTRVMEVNLDLSAFKVTDTKGKVMLLDEVLSKVKPNTVVLRSARSSMPDARYLQVFHPDTLILIPLATPND